MIFFFLALAKIFESKEIEREFKELIYELIPALNECERCEILKYKYCYKFHQHAHFAEKQDVQTVTDITILSKF